MSRMENGALPLPPISLPSPGWDNIRKVRTKSLSSLPLSLSLSSPFSLL